MPEPKPKSVAGRDLITATAAKINQLVEARRTIALRQKDVENYTKTASALEADIAAMQEAIKVDASWPPVTGGRRAGRTNTGE